MHLGSVSPQSAFITKAQRSRAAKLERTTLPRSTGTFQVRTLLPNLVAPLNFRIDITHAAVPDDTLRRIPFEAHWTRERLAHAHGHREAAG